MTDIKSIVDNNSEAIRNAVSEKLSHLTSGTEDYITAWKALQDEAAEVVVDILKPLLPNCEFCIPKGDVYKRQDIRIFIVMSIIRANVFLVRLSAGTGIALQTVNLL